MCTCPYRSKIFTRMQIISTPDFFSVAGAISLPNRFRAHRNTNTQQNTATQITTIRRQIRADSLLATGYCLLLTAHCLLPTAHCPLPTAHCPLPTAHCPLFTVHCPPTASYSLLTTHYYLHAGEPRACATHAARRDSPDARLQAKGARGGARGGACVSA